MHWSLYGYGLFNLFSSLHEFKPGNSVLYSVYYSKKDKPHQLNWLIETTMYPNILRNKGIVSKRENMNQTYVSIFITDHLNNGSKLNSNVCQ